MARGQHKIQQFLNQCQFLRQQHPPLLQCGAAGSGGQACFKAHPHMLRHACGFQLANKGTDTRTLQAYLGHRNIQHTVRYTELSPARFKNLWRD